MNCCGNNPVNDFQIGCFNNFSCCLVETAGKTGKLSKLFLSLHYKFLQNIFDKCLFEKYGCLAVTIKKKQNNLPIPSLSSWFSYAFFYFYYFKPLLSYRSLVYTFWLYFPVCEYLFHRWFYLNTRCIYVT